MLHVTGHKPGLWLWQTLSFLPFSLLVKNHQIALLKLAITVYSLTWTLSYARLIPEDEYQSAVIKTPFSSPN